MPEDQPVIARALARVRALLARAWTAHTRYLSRLEHHPNSWS